MKQHALTEEIPAYLKPYIATQDPSLYTAIDQATWRFILKVSQEFFSKYAHQKYRDGLRLTGISTERIPLISEMDQCLRKFQWRAVPVVGFIPPAAFMEFLSLGILPIACDIRTLEHLAYTPVPDIVHEAAGHAPILADLEYATYLRSYGEVSRKAIYSKEDLGVYEAIRELSDLKEDPHSKPEAIQASEERLNQAISKQSYVSEATRLSRMGWWTFEYGLIGDFNQPKIFGAGLLSSLGESYHCLGPKVKKIPFSVECAQTAYDITRPQPQLFVAADFPSLEKGLEQLAKQMAFKRGGVEGLEKAIQAGSLTTTELDSGVQISGVLTELRKDAKGEVYFIKFKGPTQISVQDQQVQGQGADYHKEGFSTPLHTWSAELLESVARQVGQPVALTLDGGISLQGKLIRCIRHGNQPRLFVFEDCTIKQGEEFLFRPDWGTFDMACGKKVVSVFGGAADRKSYLEATGGFQQAPANPKTNLTAENKELNTLYAQMRKLREELRSRPTQDLLAGIHTIHEALEGSYPKDWLLRYEVLEMLEQMRSQGIELGKIQGIEKKIRQRLGEISSADPEYAEIIQRGLSLLTGEA